MEFINESNGQAQTGPDVILSHVEEAFRRDDRITIPKAESRGEAFLRRCKIDLLSEIPPDPACISIERNGKAIKFGTLGNISLLIGKAKSKKTFAVSMVLAAALPDSQYRSTIKCNFPENKKHIVYFDTEQSNDDAKAAILRSFIMAGQSKEIMDKSIDVYGGAGEGPGDIVEGIDTYLNRRNDVGLVVIDGARDLIFDILNSKESVTIATNLRRWTKEKHVHILTVLHQNKGDSNSRGHFGAELENKAETVAEIIKHKIASISTVQPFKCRGREFEKFSFEVDDNGIPHILEDFNSEGEPDDKQPRKKIPHQIHLDKHLEAIRIMFSTNDQIEGGKIYDEVMEAYSTLGIDFGATVARRFLTYLIKKSLIKQLLHQKGNKSLYLLPVTK